MKRIGRNHTMSELERRIPQPPAETVALGETFVVETSTCGKPVINSQKDCLLSGFEERRETGPVYIEGVKAGDMVRVEILDIAVVGHASGARYAEHMDFCEVRGDTAYCLGGLPVPVNPMIGVISLVPKNPQDAEYDLSDTGGNLDYRDICAPNSVCLMAQHDGGLLFIGDLHAYQGWGEWLGVGLECAGDVTLRVSIEKTFISPRPVVVKKDAFTCIASRKTYGEAVDAALNDAAAVLQRLINVSYENALNYCKLVGNGMNGQMWHVPYPGLFSKEHPAVDMPVTVGIEIPTEILKRYSWID